MLYSIIGGNMNKLVIIGQVIGFIGLFFSLCSFTQNKKDKYAKYAIISASINVIHYLLLSAYSGVFTKAVAAFRETLVYEKAKKGNKLNNIWFYLIILVYLVSLFVLYDGNIIHLFPIFAAIIYFSIEWTGNTTSIRIVALISAVMWLVYNMIVFSISGIIHNIITITTLTIVLIKNKNSKKSRKK